MSEDVTALIARNRELEAQNKELRDALDVMLAADYEALQGVATPMASYEWEIGPAEQKPYQARKWAPLFTRNRTGGWSRCGHLEYGPNTTLGARRLPPGRYKVTFEPLTDAGSGQEAQ